MFGRKDDWYERSDLSDSGFDSDSSVSDDEGSKFGAYFCGILCIIGVLAILGLLGFMIYDSVNVKVIDVQKSVVPVQIYDEYQREDYNTYVSTGKALVPVHHDAVYKITFEYDDMKFVIDDEKVYAKYYDNIGRFIDASLEVTALSDGSMKYRIVELEPDIVNE